MGSAQIRACFVAFGVISVCVSLHATAFAGGHESRLEQARLAHFDAQEAETLTAEAHPAKSSKRTYHWQANLAAFLHEIFIAAGIDDQEAVNQAYRVKGLMNPNFDWRRAPARRLVEFALNSVGYPATEGEDPTSEVIAAIEARFGELAPSLPPDPAQHAEAERRVPINAQPLYHWEFNITAFVMGAFESLGHDSETAYEMAKVALISMGLENKNTSRYRETDWDKVDPHSLLVEAFTSVGYHPFIARSAAGHALASLGVPGWQQPRDAAARSRSGTCPGYKVLIIWCDGNGDQHTATGFMARNKWEAIAACPADSVCPPGEDPWYELTMRGGCVPEAPLTPVCVWINAISSLISNLDCDDINITFDCFDETDPELDCTEIETTCGDSQDGPSGCPGCD